MKISVVIPCYNGEHFIEETLQSVLAQTLQPHEILVVDDGSTDNSAAIAQRQSSLVKVISQPNQGESVARNHGIELATGDWIAFLDADDLWEPEKLERQRATVSPRDIACCTVTVKSKQTEDGLQPVSELVPDPINFTQAAILRELAPLHISSLLVRQSAESRFPKWTSFAEDSIYLLDLVGEGNIAVVRSPLSVYRLHSGSQSSRADVQVKWIEAFYQWLTEHSGIHDESGFSQLEAAIRDNLNSAINHAYWERNWETHKALTSFAKTKPAIDSGDYRSKRYPSMVYFFRDKIFGSGS